MIGLKMKFKRIDLKQKSVILLMILHLVRRMANKLM